MLSVLQFASPSVWRKKCVVFPALAVCVTYRNIHDRRASKTCLALATLLLLQLYERALNVTFPLEESLRLCRQQPDLSLVRDWFLSSTLQWVHEVSLVYAELCGGDAMTTENARDPQRGNGSTMAKREQFPPCVYGTPTFAMRTPLSSSSPLNHTDRRGFVLFFLSIVVAMCVIGYRRK